MRRIGGRLTALLSALVCAGCVAAPAPSPLSGAPASSTSPGAGASQNGNCGGESPPRRGDGAWHCVWSDEFDGTSLSSTWQAIPYGLGSSCLFNDPDHVQVRDGELHLIASRLPPNHWCFAEWGLQYGGGGIQTDSFAQQYGRFEIRAKLPAGAGLWPAFWLLPADQSFSGEIDVLEAYGGRNALGDATIHSPASGPGPQRSCPILPSPYTDFHTYRLEWQHGRIQMYYDDKLCADITGMSDAGVSPPPLPKVFDQPYHILLNLAVQPWWPPDASTTLPATMQIDYVRVWR